MNENNNMKKIILSYLEDVERENNVKVLLAVESGSRAWGFHSPESDWDVRFVYVHQIDWYLKVNDGRDVIEHMYDDDVDLVGWDLRKTLRLFQKSNPALMEWLHSPIIYRADEVFLSRMRGLEPTYFNPIKTMYHYGSIYIKQDRRYLQNTAYPLKRFLYYLRGILACRWVEERRSMPPVLFIDLVNGTVKEEDIRQKINELLALKRQSKENNLKEVNPGLVEYARHWADYYTDNIKLFRPELNHPSSEALDSILFDMVQLHTKRETPIIPKTYTDWSFNEDEQQNYRFVVKRDVHGLHPSDRVRISRIGLPLSQYGTVLRVEDDGIIIHTDEGLDISEEYSIELISTVI